MRFTQNQHDELRAGEYIERTFAVKLGEVGSVQACPFRIGQIVAAQREGARRAAFKVEVVDCWQIQTSCGRDWNVLFRKVVAPQPRRLLGPGGRYTTDPDKCIDPEAGEAPPLDRHADMLAEHVIAKRRAALDAMHEAFGADPSMARQLRAIERQAEKSMQEAA